MTKEIGLREKKKGLLKFQLIDVMQRQLEIRNFDNIRVKELCREVNTSEVTFFKYFEKKEELLQYFMLIWNYKREMRIAKNGRLTGRAGIDAIFNDICSTRNAQQIMLTLFSYFTHLHEKPNTLVLQDYEKQLLFENEEIIKPISLDDQIILHINEAVRLNQLPESIDVMRFTVLLSSIYYGTPLIAHMTGESMQKLYSDNINEIFKTDNRRVE